MFLRVNFGAIVDHFYADDNLNTTRNFDKLEEEITRVSNECIENRLAECEYDAYEA